MAISILRTEITTSPLISKEPIGTHTAGHHTVWAARNTAQESQDALGFLPWAPGLASRYVDAIDPDEVRLMSLDLLLSRQLSVLPSAGGRGKRGTRRPNPFAVTSQPPEVTRLEGEVSAGGERWELRPESGRKEDRLIPRRVGRREVAPSLQVGPGSARA